MRDMVWIISNAIAVGRATRWASSRVGANISAAARHRTGRTRFPPAMREYRIASLTRSVLGGSTEATVSSSIASMAGRRLVMYSPRSKATEASVAGGAVLAPSTTWWRWCRAVWDSVLNAVVLVVDDNDPVTARTTKAARLVLETLIVIDFVDVEWGCDGGGGGVDGKVSNCGWLLEVTAKKIERGLLRESINNFDR
jgi:hypothetical protein